MSQSAHRAPDWRSRRAMASPMPCAPPVTTADLPRRSIWFMRRSVGSHRFSDEVLLDERFVQRHTESGSVGHCYPSIASLKFLVRQLVPHRRIVDAILEDKRVAACAEPV